MFVIRGEIKKHLLHSAAYSLFAPGLVRVINSHVVIYSLWMVVRLSGVRVLDILVFTLCHRSHLHVLSATLNGHSIGHSMQFLVELLVELYCV